MANPPYTTPLWVLELFYGSGKSTVSGLCTGTGVYNVRIDRVIIQELKCGVELAP